MKEIFALIIDQGTHATRAMVVDGKGRVCLSATEDVPLNRLNDAKVEQDGTEILRSVEAVIFRVLDSARLQGMEPIYAGMATQRSSVIAWDRETGKPFSPIISWQDRRVAPQIAALVDHGPKIKSLSGLPLSPHYGAGKIKWLFEHLPEVRNAASEGRLAWGPLASYLLFHLLRERPYVVDHANAQRTQLWNLHSRNWDSCLLSLFRLPPVPLPACLPVCNMFGWLKVADIPMTAVGGDQGAAFFSLGKYFRGDALVNIGTGAFILLSTGEKPVFRDGLLSGIAASADKMSRYVLEGTVNGAGAALDWAAREWGIKDIEPCLDEWLSTESKPPLFINAVGGIGSPWWCPDAVSFLVGGGPPWQRVVAVAESILFLIRANMDAMTASGCEIKTIRITGGLARLDGMCRRLADLTGKPVYRPAETEATVRGMAWLALGRPDYWPKPGRGQWFKPVSNQALLERYHRYLGEIRKIVSGGWK